MPGSVSVPCVVPARSWTASLRHECATRSCGCGGSEPAPGGSTRPRSGDASASDRYELGPTEPFLLAEYPRAWLISPWSNPTRFSICIPDALLIHTRRGSSLVRVFGSRTLCAATLVLSGFACQARPLSQRRSGTMTRISTLVFVTATGAETDLDSGLRALHRRPMPGRPTHPTGRNLSTGSGRDAARKILGATV